MLYRLKHNIDPYYTHQPVLYEILMKTTGSILELGCGEGSTELIHLVAKKCNRKIVTVESDLNWIKKYEDKFSSKDHIFLKTKNHSIQAWNDIVDTFIENKWGLIFIDQGFWDARAYSFQKLKNYCDYLILHDCDYLPEHNLLGICHEKFVNENNRGKRDYSKDINYWKEYFPIFFVGHTGPPTLLASQTKDCNIKVDFSKYDVII